MSNNGHFVVTAYWGWGSAFVLLWLILLGWVKADWVLLVFAFIFFVSVGVFSSAMAYNKRDAETMALLKRAVDLLDKRE